MEKIMLVGGGLAGSLLSVYLAKRGFEVHVFERRPDMRKNKISAGRSINLALSLRGIAALEKVGLANEVLSDGIPMYGRMIHSLSGELSFQPYGKEGQAIYSVSRGRLNIRLLELADRNDNIHLYFNHRCIDVDYNSGTATFELEDGTKKSYNADRIIGTDGAFSAARSKMQISDRFNYSQSYLEHGYKELEILPKDGEFALKANCLHIWPRGSYMMIALPNPDKTFTCTLFFPFEGDPSFASLDSKEKVTNFFGRQFPDAVPLMPGLSDDFFSNPTGSLVTVKCFPWVKDGKAALLGDAAHAIVPFFGQGMNCAFEDCIVLDEMLDKHLPDWNNVFEQYQNSRKPNTDAIADLAVQNFVEMRDLVGNPDFLHKKHVEHELCELYPDIFKSQYEMVTFTRVPYRYALEQGERNWKLVEKLVDMGYEDRLGDKDLIMPLLQSIQN